MQELLRIRCFLLDMDGTIYLGRQLLPGANRFLAALREREIEFYFLTNNSSRNRDDYVEKLAGLGIGVAPEQVVTSGEATARYLQTVSPGARLYMLGTASLAREFREHGFTLVGRDEAPDYVVVGFDTTLTYDKLWAACDLLRGGVGYIATHADLTCPLEGGGAMPDAGAIIAFLEAATGRRPKVIGKPNPEMVAAVLNRSRWGKDQTAIVGDRLYTDIALGQAAGITSVLVLSGETRREDLSRSRYKPDHVVASVAQLTELLGG